MIRKTQTKVAACLVEQAAGKNLLHNEAYPKADSLSRAKHRLLVEIRGLAGALLSPFSAPQEKATSEALFRSTVRKLDTLQ